jgi:hypothetical protein
VTPEQAFQIIANLCSQVKLTLDEHKGVQQALQLLKPTEKPIEQLLAEVKPKE